MTTPPIERVTAWMVVLPLRTAFASARTRIHERRLVLIQVCAGEHTGWGEAAPVPGHTAENIDDIWERFTVAETPGGFGDVPGLLGAARDEAYADLAARQSSLALWRVHGGTRPVPASAAVGLNDAGDPDRRVVESAAAAGYRFAKLKVTQHTKPLAVAALVADYPQIRFGADANGSMTPGNENLLKELDELGLEYLEQPGPADDIDWHVRLRSRLMMPVSLDEGADSPEKVRRIVATGAADIVNLKVGRFGPRQTLQLADEVVAAGLRVRIGGLIESGIGRAHSVAVAAHDHFSVVGDIAGSDRFFDDDLVRPQWRVHDGLLSLPESPGIGVEVDKEAVAAHAVASLSIP
jgi:O-succinylbenzoate synthase